MNDAIIIKQNDINFSVIEKVGQKAMGLLDVPLEWSLPFFVVSSDAYEKYRNSNTDDEKDIVLNIVAKAIMETTREELHSTEIIVRSSGINENLKDRGKYESKQCDVVNVKDTIKALFEGMISENRDEKMAYVVQPYVINEMRLHISNERRLSLEKRDWMIEQDGDNEEKDYYSIGVRKWRNQYDVDIEAGKELICTNTTDLKNIIRIVASYYTQKNIRTHLEGVWNGKRLYIVQCDIEKNTPEGSNPKAYSIKIKRKKDKFSFNVLRNIRDNDFDTYRKIHNIKIYKDLGLTTPPIYILDNMEEIKKLSEGEISKELEEDINQLVLNSMVIRTDFENSVSTSENMLPRSEELRSLDQVKEWGSQNLPNLIKDGKKIVLLIHIFIPAIASAFAYCNPNSRKVQIHSLWGLPEGLYYNSHDTTYVDTIATNIDLMCQESFFIRKYPSYKERYYAPTDNGEWEEKKTLPNSDWNYSLTKVQIRQIAYDTRKIANKEKKAVSVMWFVGIDRDYYQADCIPWHHEECHDIETRFQKKYITDQCVEIHSEEDFFTIAESEDVKYIRIHPNTESCMRNKGFLKQVADYVKDKDITIVIEGTTLAHPYYALREITDKVIVLGDMQKNFGEMRFNKLVRDKIPEKISGNMEEVVVKKATPILHRSLLLEKLIEEGHELIEAQNRSEIIEETADLLEVIYAVRKYFSQDMGVEGHIKRERKSFELGKTKTTKIFEIENVDITTTYSCTQLLNSENEVFCNYRAEKEGTEIRNEFIFGLKMNNELDEKESDNGKKQILTMCYESYFASQNEAVHNIMDDIEKRLYKMLEENDINFSEVEAVRKRKAKKSGQFDSRLVLLETKMDDDKKEPFGDNYPIQFDLPSSVHCNYVDLRTIKNQQELIVRCFLPLAFNSWYCDFRSKKISEFFKSNVFLRIEFCRSNLKYKVSGFIIQDFKVEQLSFDY